MEDATGGTTSQRRATQGPAIASHALSLDSSMFLDDVPAASSQQHWQATPLASGSETQQSTADCQAAGAQETAQKAARPAEPASDVLSGQEAILSPFAALTTQSSYPALTTYPSLASEWLQNTASPRYESDEEDMKSLSCSERSVYLQVAEDLAGEDQLSLASSSKNSSCERNLWPLLHPYKSGPTDDAALRGLESPKLSKEVSDAVQRLKSIVPKGSLHHMKGSYGLVDVLKWDLQGRQGEAPGGSAPTANARTGPPQ